MCLKMDELEHKEGKYKEENCSDNTKYGKLWEFNKDLSFNVYVERNSTKIYFLRGYCRGGIRIYPNIANMSKIREALVDAFELRIKAEQAAGLEKHVLKAFLDMGKDEEFNQISRLNGQYLKGKKWSLEEDLNFFIFEGATIYKWGRCEVGVVVQPVLPKESEQKEKIAKAILLQDYFDQAVFDGDKMLQAYLIPHLVPLRLDQLKKQGKK